MVFKHRSFFIATVIALSIQIVAILVFKAAYLGLDCGLLEHRICSFPVFLQGVAYLVASINVYTLGVPTILMALLIGGAYRMYRELRDAGMKRREFIKPQI